MAGFDSWLMFAQSGTVDAIELVLAAWVAVLPVGVLLWRTIHRLLRSVDLIAQHFDSESEVSKAVGTIPDRLTFLEVDVRNIKRETGMS